MPPQLHWLLSLSTYSCAHGAHAENSSGAALATCWLPLSSHIDLLQVLLHGGSDFPLHSAVYPFVLAALVPVADVAVVEEQPQVTLLLTLLLLPRPVGQNRLFSEVPLGGLGYL